MLSKIIYNAGIVEKTIGYKLYTGIATLANEAEACTKPKWAYYFAKNIPGVDIEKCQEVACKDPVYAYMFARDIPGAYIEKCQEGACKNPWLAYRFANDIPGENIEKCRKVCKGTKYAF